MARDLAIARLDRKTCISIPAQCYHFEFVVDALDQLDFTPGQFISAVAEDENGKQQTRAYSIASAPSGNRFSLCVNRVEAGFFSNHLADLPEDGDGLLPVGGLLHMHGPHGFFTLRQPLTDTILVATGTGIAPMRSMLQWLFPEDGASSGRSQDQQIWLVYGTRHESELYYRDELESLAQRAPNFHYLPTLSRPRESWAGLRGYVQEHVERIVRERAARLGQTLPLPPADGAVPEQDFDVHAYICGLNEMVTGVRDRLSGLGWRRKQIVYERYD